MTAAFRLHIAALARRALICAALLLFLMGGAACAERQPAPEGPEEEEIVPEEALVYSRVVNIPGLGEMMYYAQNDPQWADMVYEAPYSAKRNRMRGGACGPTNLAMALARQLPDEALPKLLAEAKRQSLGFQFCRCSVTRDYHGGDHGFVDPRTPEEFKQYLPVILANYATGNNIHYLQYRYSGSGTNASMFRAIGEFYGLKYESTRDWAVAREALENGYSVITTVTRGIFTSSSHYLTIAGIADGYVYILDSLMRTEYPADHNQRLEVVEPGVVRTPVDQISHLYLYGYYMLKAE